MRRAASCRSIRSMPATHERPRPAGLAETGASTLAILLVLATAWHGFGVYFCLGSSCPGPDAGQILTYRLLAGALACAVVAALALAVRRGARWALLWHLAVAAAAFLVAVVFAVPSIDLDDLREPDRPERNPEYTPCHSGPPNDCPGG